MVWGNVNFFISKGYKHEQARSDRDDYVTINWSNIVDRYKSQFTKCTTCELQNTAYDYGSVMHYPDWAFAIDPSIPTIVAKNGAHIGQRNGFSAIDIIRLNTLYSCGKKILKPI